MTTANAAPWLRVVVEAPNLSKLVDAISEALLCVCAPGVEVQDDTTMASTLDPEPPPEGRARLVAYLEATTPDAIAGLRASIMHLGEVHGSELTFDATPFDDTSWQDAWKAFFKPAQVSPRIAIRAPWAEFDAADGVEVLIIEPGMAFGTGLHETTRLCIQALDRHIDAETPPTWLLDVGCGSGVLSIAAARLGVPRVVGVDVDAIAATVSADNAVANDVASVTEFSTRALDAIPDAAPLVVANILAHILLSMRAELAAHTAPGGHLILSGVLDRERDSVEAAFCAEGMACVRAEVLGEWVALELRRLP